MYGNFTPVKNMSKCQNKTKYIKQNRNADNAACPLF